MLFVRFFCVSELTSSEEISFTEKSLANYMAENGEVSSYYIILC